MFVEVGKGIKYSIDDNGLMTIVVDTSKDFGLSGSGKSTMIATSSGNQKINMKWRRHLRGYQHIQKGRCLNGYKH